MKYFFFIGWLVFVAAPAWSSDLYHAQVVVTDTTEEYRLPALKKVLQQVLTKLTGIHDIELTAKQVGDIEQWVQQFSYKSEAGEVWLQASFEHKSINQLLKKLGLTIWSSSRPTFLVWIIHNQEVINEIHQVNRAQALKVQAEKRGIDITFPILDLQEKRQFPIKQITSYTLKDVKQLIDRYAVNVALIGIVTAIDNSPETEQQAKWILFHGEKQETWQHTHKQLNQLLAMGMDKAIDKLAPSTIQNANAVSQQPDAAIIHKNTLSTILTLTVVDVPNLRIYAQIKQYLEKLPEVQDIEMKNMSSNQIVFKIKANTTLAQFTKILAASKLIKVQSQNQNHILGQFYEQ